MKMTDTLSAVVTRNNAVFAAQMMDSFARILAQETHATHVLAYDPSAPTNLASLSERIGIGCAHTMAGFLFLSIQAADLLETLIDWNEWGGAVFSYDHLDAIGDGRPARLDMSLPAYLYRRITDDEWYQIVCRHRLPSEKDLGALIRDWVRALETCHEGKESASCIPPIIPTLVPVDERGCDKEQLRDRYGDQHPGYPHDLWKQRVIEDRTACGYWDWVIEEIAQHWANKP